MAISPTQARKVIESQRKIQRKIINDLEKQIDAAIVGVHRAGGTRTNFWSRELENDYVREGVERSYRTAGWRVGYTNDQREGEYLTFSAREKKRIDQRDALVAPYER